MTITIEKSSAFGDFYAPPSKSQAIREIICSALADGESILTNVGCCDDVNAALNCVRAFGAELDRTEHSVRIRGIGAPPKPSALPCGASAAVLRLLAPVCCLEGGARFLCDRQLLARPHELFNQFGLQYSVRDNEMLFSWSSKSTNYAVTGALSSQFISGLLIALPMIDENSFLEILPPIVSSGYISMTCAALKRHGIHLEQNGNAFRIKGGQRYQPASTVIEGDCSNAAFFAALNLFGNSITIHGIPDSTLQPDGCYPELFKKLTAENATINIAEFPDLAPILFCIAAAFNGGRLTGTSRLAAKESDRAASMAEELQKLGARVVLGEDSVEIFSSPLHMPDRPLSSHGDHRVAMALAILLTKTGGAINGAEAVTKSFPDFFDILQSHTKKAAQQH